ncbi:MAG: hypothetical protein GQE15_20310 [Archangiaceae bacterium]|nr:hypothetical protein [Archangiaceae bacterium]
MNSSLRTQVVELCLRCMVSEGLVPTRPNQPAEEIAFLGKSAVCDSVNLVAYLVALEEQVGSEFKVPVALMDDKAMSLSKSPFRTVATLADFITSLLQEKQPS